MRMDLERNVVVGLGGGRGGWTGWRSRATGRGGLVAFVLASAARRTAAAFGASAEELEVFADEDARKIEPDVLQFVGKRVTKGVDRGGGDGHG